MHVRTTTTDFQREIDYVSVGWEIAEDVIGKPGLLSNSMGSSAVFRVSAPSVAMHCHIGVLHLFHLNSYAHMGQMVATVSVIAVVDGVCKAPAVEVASRTIDCMWDKHESITVFDELVFGCPNSSACVELRVTASGADPPRAENKLKLFGFALF